jgi:hypothetical protein
VINSAFQNKAERKTSLFQHCRQRTHSTLAMTYPGFEQEEVPDRKLFRGFSTRDNSDYKWQRARGIVGALEVYSQPYLNLQEALTPRHVTAHTEVFQDALHKWEELKLRETFIEACDSLPRKKCCCGLLADDDATIKEFVPLLNENWIKLANKKLLDAGFKVDCFLWNWQNASGKSETNILLIRFYELSSYRLRKASLENCVDFDASSKKEDDDTVPAVVAQSRQSRPTHAGTAAVVAEPQEMARS